MPRLALDSPLGRLTLFEEDGRLTALDFGGKRPPGEPTKLLLEAKRQLAAYFDGRRKEFDLPLAPAGSPFELRVWQLMSDIPYGDTRTYGDLARTLAAAPRAVGQACGRNPLPILIPCHRVLAADGRLGGYSGGKGAETKRRLLMLEGALLV
ncbi:MAG TPA: methylated-DNA--[protein]-cysteine S-methyltransferase [Stellaceae bacterium]